MKRIIKLFVILLMVLTINTAVYAEGSTKDVDTATWGNKVNYNGHSIYVKDEGNILQWSVPVTKGFNWIRSEYIGYSTWYALDNTKGTYEDGSMFWVRIYLIDNAEFNDYRDSLDGDISTNESTNSNWIINFGVTKLDGTSIEFDNDNKFLKNVDLYIQIGDMWDKEDINNYLEEKNESSVKYIDLNKDDIKGVFAKIGNHSSAVGTTFSQGNTYIICGIAAVFVIIGIIAFMVSKKIKSE